MLHIPAAQIQKPGDLIQRCHKQSIRSVFLHLFPHFLNLILSGKSRIGNLQLPHRLCRKRRPVFPDQIHQISFPVKSDLFFICFFPKFFHEGARHRPPVESDHIPLRELLSQIRRQCRDIRLSTLHQLDPASRQLTLRL